MLGINYLMSYTLGFIVSTSNAFYWNNKYVFTEKKEKNVVIAFLKVFASYGMSFLISIAIMNVLVVVLKISSLIAPILKMVVTIPINFVMNKFGAFKDDK